MTEENKNPYQSPESDIISEEMSATSQLAGRGTRLVAAIIDSIIMLSILVPIMFAMGVFGQIMQGIEPDFATELMFSFIGIVIYLAINGYLLANKGQTVGKYFLNIAIVDMKGEKMDFGKLIGLRYVPLWIVQSIPLLNILGLIDVLFIFRSDRRCIHDLIAGTKVVEVIK